MRDSATGGDGELLTRYRTLRDQDAFGSLVRRHGPMVLGVCRRVLRDYHAADDAFQATFLVLAKKADAVRPPDRLAPWLYGVAYRTAMKARGRAFRRQQVEQEYATEVREPAAAPASDDATRPAADHRRATERAAGEVPRAARAVRRAGAEQGRGRGAARTAGRDRFQSTGACSRDAPRPPRAPRRRRARRRVRRAADGRHAASRRSAGAGRTTSAIALGSTATPATVLTLSNEVIRSMTLFKLNFLTPSRSPSPSRAAASASTRSRPRRRSRNE